MAVAVQSLPFPEQQVKLRNTFIDDVEADDVPSPPCGLQAMRTWPSLLTSSSVAKVGDVQTTYKTDSHGETPLTTEVQNPTLKEEHVQEPATDPCTGTSSEFPDDSPEPPCGLQRLRTFDSFEDSQIEMTSNSVANVVGRRAAYHIDPHDEAGIATEVQSLEFGEQCVIERNSTVERFDDQVFSPPRSPQRTRTWSEGTRSPIGANQWSHAILAPLPVQDLQVLASFNSRVKFQFTDESGDIITLSRGDGQIEVNVAGYGNVGDWEGFELKEGRYRAGDREGVVPDGIIREDLMRFLKDFAQASGMASIGAVSHASGKCKPCLFFWRPQGCDKGDACCHCHDCPQGALKAWRKARDREGKKC
jgi:hypothetical protein